MKNRVVNYIDKYLPKEFAELNNGYYKAIKSHTGSGGTTAMLKGNIPTIILTPNVSHIKSKEANRINFDTNNIKVIYLYQGCQDKLSDYINYKNKGFTVHIYTTYHRFILESFSFEQLFSNSHRLVADEYHVLTTNEYMKVTDSFLKLYKEFKTVILTTATKPEVDLFSTFETVSFVNTAKPKQVVKYKQFGKRSQMIKQLISECNNSDSHIVLLSNDIELHAKLFIDTDNVVGQGLEKKVAIYNPNHNYKEIDYSKKIHVLSCAAWEGLDFEEDCRVIAVAEFTNSDYKAHKVMTKTDLIQGFGRGRKSIKDVCFFYTKSHSYIEDLRASNFKDNIYKEETKRGVLALLSNHLNEHSYSMKRVNYQDKIEIDTKKIIKAFSQKDLVNNISKYPYRNDVANNIFDHLSLSRIIERKEDLSSCKGKQYGLNETEACLFLTHKILSNSGALGNVSSKVVSRTNSTIKYLIEDVLKGISLANSEIGFLNGTVKNMIEPPKRPTTLQKKIAATIQNLGLETEFFLNGSQSLQDTSLLNQEESFKFQRDRAKVLLYVNLIGLYNSSKVNSSLKEAIEKKANEKDSDKTTQQYKQQHKQFLIERLIAFNGLTHLIELEVKSRRYSTLTSHPSELRKFTTLHSIEYDIEAAYPTIVAHKFSKNLDVNKVYYSKENSRKEMKVIVNTLLNQHTENGYNINHWRNGLVRNLSMSLKEANYFIERFNKKGSFFEYASNIEETVINSIKPRINVVGSTAYRLHDAFIVFGTNRLDNVVGFDTENEPYKFNIEAA
jgi:hypothetical protein